MKDAFERLCELESQIENGNESFHQKTNKIAAINRTRKTIIDVEKFGHEMVNQLILSWYYDEKRCEDQKAEDDKDFDENEEN